MKKFFEQVQTFVSKKLILGPAAATGLLANGDITGWQWTAVTIGYLAIQGLVDIAKAKKEDNKDFADNLLGIVGGLQEAMRVVTAVDEQNKVTPKPGEVDAIYRKPE